VSASLRILLVEDHHDTRELLASYLESQGHRVVVAESIADARDYLQHEGRFDLMLSDVGLPDGRAWQLMDASLPRPAIAVAMSGFGAPSDVERSLKAGFAEHLIKPVGLGEIDRVLALAAARATRSE
jgi:CheY-like chemotaxis protein